MKQKELDDYDCNSVQLCVVEAEKILRSKKFLIKISLTRLIRFEDSIWTRRVLLTIPSPGEVKSTLENGRKSHKGLTNNSSLTLDFVRGSEIHLKADSSFIFTSLKKISRSRTDIPICDEFRDDIYQFSMNRHRKHPKLLFDRL